MTGRPCLTVPCPRRLRAHSTQPVLLVVIGSGGKGVSRPETATPSMILYFFDSMILDLLDNLRFSTSRPPPLPPIPFLVQPYLFQTPSLQTAGVWGCYPRSTSLRRSSLDPVNLTDNQTSRSLCDPPTPPHTHTPCSPISYYSPSSTPTLLPPLPPLPITTNSTGCVE